MSSIVTIESFAIIQSVVHGVASLMEALVPIIANDKSLVNETVIRTNVEVGDLLFYGFDASPYTTNPLLKPRLPEEFEDDKFSIYRAVNKFM